MKMMDDVLDDEDVSDCGEGRGFRAGAAGASGWAQKRQVRMYFCLERAANREKVETCCIPRASRSNKRQDGYRMMRRRRRRRVGMMMRKL